MNRGARRTLIPNAHGDLSSWPAPDSNALGEQDKLSFLSRRRAVEMYAANRPYGEIKAETGKSEDEVQRLVKRCVTAAPDGMIYGFQALVPGSRLSGYVRRAPVPKSSDAEGSSFVGAFEQLLSRFPEIRELIESAFLNRTRRGEMGERQMPITKIHGKFKAELIKLGFTNRDWPFNTENCGYNALSAYCRKLRLSDSQEAALSRSGEEAARRGKIGKGIRSLINARRPYSFVQLDFHKVDAASTISITNDFGVEQEINVARWHIGLLVDEYSAAILGAYVTLEKTPSGDSTLEVIESAVMPMSLEERNDDPKYALVNDKRVLLHELMPRLEYQCFSVLKVDNGWSNAADEVVNNIMDTVGCAVSFGPVRAWWTRNLIERIFLELTRRGLQRLPSTFGSGPGDSRIKKPNESAIRFKIRMSELASIIYGYIRAHNVETTEGRQWSAPVEVIQSALQHDQAGFFEKPLPTVKQNSPQLFTHTEIVTVRGSVERNERPFFLCDRWRYTNETLAHAPWLIGKKLMIYVNRRLCRIVHASVLDTGERLGRMHPPGKWAESKLSWRDRKLINRSGQSKRNHSLADDPYEEYQNSKKAAVKASAKSRKLRSSTEALDLARLEMAEKRNEQRMKKHEQSDASISSPKPLKNEPQLGHKPASPPRLQVVEPTVPTQTTNPKSAVIEPLRPRHDPFGLNLVPKISSVKKVK